MKKRKVTILVEAIVMCLVIAGASRAGSIDTLSSWTGASIHTFGELSGNNPGAVTFGQTFVIHEEHAHLDSIEFMVSDYAPTTAPEVCTFEVFIMAWDGSSPTGPVLFQSEPLITTGEFGNYDNFIVDLKGISVIAGQEYIVLFTANNFLNGIRSDAAMAIVDNIYADGILVTHHGFSFDDLLNGNWRVPFSNSRDFAIRLEYTVVSVSLTGLEITGPNEAPDNNSVQYAAIAHYDDGSTMDVTLAASWSVDANDFGKIDANGVLTTEQLYTVEETIILSAEYTENYVTAAAEKEVVIFADCTVADLVGRNILTAIEIKQEMLKNIDKALESEHRAKSILEEFAGDYSFSNWSNHDKSSVYNNLAWSIRKQMHSKQTLGECLKKLQEIQLVVDPNTSS